MAAKVNGYAVASLGAGVVLFWSGFTGRGVLATVQSVIQGKSPAGNPVMNSPQDSGTAPAATGSGSYSRQALARLWISNGGPQATSGFAAQVAISESGGRASVTSSNPDGGTNVGLWQLDTLGVGSGHSVAELQDPDTNAQVTISATGGGYNWSEWSDPVVNALPGHMYNPAGGG